MASDKILLVDDDPGFLTALTKMLTKQRYIVTSVSDASSAVDEMKSPDQKFDLVITDLSMPMISGLSLLNALKSALPDVKVIVVTAVGDPITRANALRDGAVGFFNKPLDREEFLGVVERVLNGDRRRTD